MSSQQALTRYQTEKNAYLEDLKTLVRIPSVSFAGFDPKQVRRSAEATAELLKKRGFENVKLLEAAGAHLYVPRDDRDYAIAVGLRMLVLRRVVEEAGGIVRAREEERRLLEYYANSVAHLR